VSLAPAHSPVMLDEVLAALALRPGARVVDATFGAGGYSRACLATGAQVLALDRDPTAARFAPRDGEAGHDRFTLRQMPFSELEAALAEHGWTGCEAVVFDVGVSSMQLDEAERGFSFLRDGPLDMRMGADGETAADLVNTAEPGDLVRILRRYGEEAQARRIVATLVRRRAEKPFTRTLDLAETVERAVGGRRGAPTHPATRTFQALRIAVNDELGQLEAGLRAAERALQPEGRLAVVSFHSLEDRIVKAFLTARAGRTPAGSRHAPPAPDAAPPSFRLLQAGAQAPSAAETAANPRARSAKLRAAERTAAPAWQERGMAA
jgi:16S rRNA (cytosine1402-N4)-methyltransferase